MSQYRAAFEKLDAWLRAKELCSSLVQLTTFISWGDYSIVQARLLEHAFAIPTSVAAGREHHDPAVFIEHLGQAKAACGAADACLLLLFDLGLLTSEDCDTHRELIYGTQRVITGLRTHLEHKHGLTQASRPVAASTPPPQQPPTAPAALTPYPTFTLADALVHGMIDGGLPVPNAIRHLVAPWSSDQTAPHESSESAYWMNRRTICHLLEEIVCEHARAIQASQEADLTIAHLSADKEALLHQVATLTEQVKWWQHCAGR